MSCDAATNDIGSGQIHTIINVKMEHLTLGLARLAETISRNISWFRGRPARGSAIRHMRQASVPLQSERTEVDIGQHLGAY